LEVAATFIKNTVLS